MITLVIADTKDTTLAIAETKDGYKKDHPSDCWYQRHYPSDSWNQRGLPKKKYVQTELETASLDQAKRSRRSCPTSAVGHDCGMVVDRVSRLTGGEREAGSGGGGGGGRRGESVPGGGGGGEGGARMGSLTLLDFCHWPSVRAQSSVRFSPAEWGMKWFDGLPAATIWNCHYANFMTFPVSVETGTSRDELFTGGFQSQPGGDVSFPG